MTFIMCVAESFSMAAFAAYVTLLPLFQKAWGLSNTEAGLIGGIAFAGYMTAVPVLSALTDRVDSRRIYLGACCLSALGAAGFALYAQGLWTALAFQFVIGAGLGGTYMPGLKTLTDQLEGSAQARATAFYAASFGVGSSLSIVAAGWLARFGDQGSGMDHGDRLGSRLQQGEGECGEDGHDCPLFRWCRWRGVRGQRARPPRFR